MNDAFKAEVTKAITDLQNINKQHLNRQLAFEGLMTALLHRVQPEALAGLQEEYEQACDHVAAQLAPQWQMPALWHQWSSKIEQLALKHRTPPK